MIDFRQELAATAKKICTPGKGILAADESEGTIGKKFVAIKVDNTAENRRRYREMLFSAPDFNKYISGVIMFSETVEQECKHGSKFVDILTKMGVVPGIKVDKGLQNLPFTKEESAVKGTDTLADMCKKFYKLGCRFAKWRAVLKIEKDCPTAFSIQENAWNLARYAAICQENGLVPIVEPEILADGNHSIERCQEVSEQVLSAVFRALNENHIFLEGCLLKPNMVTPGTKATPSSAYEIATRTAQALSRTVPPALAGVVFLSGGQSEEEASQNLNEMNRLLGVRKPWVLSFSYGRALQNTAVKTWAGKEENIAIAQKAFIVRAKANSEAQLGRYLGSSDKSANESLVIENYKY